GLPSWRASIPVVQVDPSFEVMDAGEGSLVKWNPMANDEGNFLCKMDVPVNSLHSRGNIKQDDAAQLNCNGNGNGASQANGNAVAAYIFDTKIWFCRLTGTGVKVGKFRAHDDQKAFAWQELQHRGFPIILFFPQHSTRTIKCPQRRGTDSLMAFVNALR
ncbi:hypothetical protein RJ641_036889, partial [Dillenia turbinata]